MAADDRKRPAPAEGADERYEAALKRLKTEWDGKLECSNRSDASRRVDAMMDACGRTKKRPIAGSTF
jgi:hypothetical protein